MAETIEAAGRTLDDAKKAAAEALGLTVEECEFTVLEEASKGLFAKTNFRVRATGKAKAEKAPAKPPKEAKPAPAAKEAKPKAVRGSRAAVDLPATEKVESEEEVTATKKDGDVVADMVNGLMKEAGIAAKAKVETLTGKYVNIQLTGKDVGDLIGNSGLGLDSLQYLSNAMLGHVLPGGVRATLDAAEYRAGREEALLKLAQDVAAAVMDRKQEAVLDALPAHERRIIHKALQEIDGVETYSEGEEPERRVVVTPKKG